MWPTLWNSDETDATEGILNSIGEGLDSEGKQRNRGVCSTSNNAPKA
jgi:hypothetical protein